MLNFTIGPVMTWDEILHVGGEQVPYFRTAEFSRVMLENEQMMLEYTGAAAGSRCVFLTGSGTMGMEAAITNILSDKDHAIVVNGGGFGKRFVDLCELHNISHSVINLEMGHPLTSQELGKIDATNCTAFVINMHETSTGVLYDMELVSDYCRKHGLLLIVDAISAFMADPLDMGEMGIDVLITSSQKAFACAPGITMLTLSGRAVERAMASRCDSMYMSVKSALVNAERGQTPFTPAVLVLNQINKRLSMISERGGMDGECSGVKKIAGRFRDLIKDMPLEMVSQSPSNAVTALHPTNGMSAKSICDRLKDEFGIWICPNGGDLSDYMFRVGHIGNISNENIDELVDALKTVLAG